MKVYLIWYSDGFDFFDLANGELVPIRLDGPAIFSTKEKAEEAVSSLKRKFFKMRSRTANEYYVEEQEVA